MPETNDIEDWLDSIGQGRYRDCFARHKVGLDVLPLLSDNDLREMEIPLGDRRRILAAVADRFGPDRSATVPDDSERRQVTVLFCDMVGYTDLSDRLDPEDLESLVERFMALCESNVRAWGGHVANFLGDGLLVYFGWPRAFEDSADRAVHAGLAIVDAVSALPGPDKTELRARVGIATGLVVVGKRLGEGAGKVETVYGATPNLAARLEALAEPGDVLIGATTRSLLRQNFALEDKGNRTFKGFAEAVQVWRVKGVARAGSERPVQDAGGLLGRSLQFATLQSAWSEVLGGGGLRMVHATGEAGMGKSRLVDHFLAAAGETMPAAHKVQCWPYHSGATLYPFVEHLRREADLPDTPEAGKGADRLDTFFQAINLPWEALRADLGDLLGLDPTPSGQTAAQRKAAWFRGLSDVLSARLGAGCGTLVVEDGHWIDPVSDEFLDYVAANCTELNLLVIATGRPQYRPDWALRSGVARIELSRLDDLTTRRLIARIATGRVLSPAHIAQIAATTDGVPLFIEELTRSVLDGGSADTDGLPGDLNIPSTLQDVLIARLDGTRHAKRTAQIASCIGRVFSRDLLEDVSDEPPDTIRSNLSTLKQAGILIDESGGRGEAFSFRHALIQETAHQSQLKTRRRAVHLAIADALERRGTFDPVSVANHLSAAGHHGRAVKSWSNAADAARRRSAQREAIGHCHRALESLAHLPASQKRDRTELELLLRLGPDLAAVDGYGNLSVRETYQRASDLASQLGDQEQRFALHRGRWMYAQMSADYEHAMSSARQMSDLANTVGKPGLVLEADRALGATSFITGKLEDARQYLEAGIPRYAEGNSASHTETFGDDPGLAALSYLGRTLWFLGFPDSSLRRCSEALDIALRVGHPFSLARTYVFVAHSHQLRGEHPALIAAASKAINISDQFGFPFFSGVARMICGWGMARSGNLLEGDKMMSRGLDDYLRSDSRMSKPWFLVLFAEIACAANRLDEALQRVDEAQGICDQTGENLVLPEAARVRGTVLEAGGDRVGAIRHYRKAHEIAVAQRSRSCELRAAMDLSQADPVAAPLLAEALDWFVEGFETADLRRARKMARVLSSSAG